MVPFFLFKISIQILKPSKQGAMMTKGIRYNIRPPIPPIQSAESYKKDQDHLKHLVVKAFYQYDPSSTMRLEEKDLQRLNISKMSLKDRMKKALGFSSPQALAKIIEDFVRSSEFQALGGYTPNHEQIRALAKLILNKKPSAHRSLKNRVHPGGPSLHLF